MKTCFPSTLSTTKLELYSNELQFQITFHTKRVAIIALRFV